MTSPKTAGEFVQIIEQSQLIAPIHLEKIRAQIPLPSNSECDALSLAKSVVKEGLLTPYQAQQLLAGQPQGFFIGKYRLLDVLGQGGMGKVFLAEQTTMKRAVALKLLRFGDHDDPSMRIRFTREARAAAKLRHINITQAFDFDQAGEYHYIAMEFVEGLNLQQWVEKTGRIPWALAASYVSQAASGLEHAWQNNLVHRDIKPSNLMVETSGVLKILDLGLVIEHTQEISLTMAQRNLILGTADYVSPEQAMDSHKVDIRADIYSLGAVFFFLLCGKPPFEGKSAFAKIVAHQNTPPQPIQELVPEVPKRLADILQRMLAKNPDERFATPAEVAKALKPFAQLATRTTPPYDLSLVRFTREQVEKYLQFGADAPTAQETRDRDLGRSTLGDYHISADMMTPKPSTDLSSVGNAKATKATLPTKQDTPRNGIPKKTGSKLPTTRPEQSTTTPAPKDKAKPSTPLPLKNPIKPKWKSRETKVETKVEQKPAARKKTTHWRWLTLAIINLLALLVLFGSLIWAR